MFDVANALLFLLAAIALLGSPGPAIAALLAVGRLHGVGAGFRFYFGLQIGLAIAAAATAAGLLSLLATVPLLMTGMTLAAAAYLISLAWKIATAPVGEDLANARRQSSPTIGGGITLGLTNPKAYIAFASLFAAYHLSPDGVIDMRAKWALTVAVMIVVDIVWLWLGAILGRVRLEARNERFLNICFGLIILATAGLSVFELVKA